MAIGFDDAGQSNGRHRNAIFFLQFIAQSETLVTLDVRQRGWAVVWTDFHIKDLREHLGRSFTFALRFKDTADWRAAVLASTTLRLVDFSQLVIAREFSVTPSALQGLTDTLPIFVFLDGRHIRKLFYDFYLVGAEQPLIGAESKKVKRVTKIVFPARSGQVLLKLFMGPDGERDWFVVFCLSQHRSRVFHC